MNDTATVVAVAAGLFNVVATVGGFCFFLIGIMRRQTILEVLVKNLTEQVKNLANTVEDLRRGDGWITSHPHKQIDREYK